MTIHTKNSVLVLAIFCAGLSPLLTGCEDPTGVQAGNSFISIVSTDPSKNVCDPFVVPGAGGGTGSGSDRGLWAKLRYLSADQPRYTHVADYLQNGHLADVDLFFSQLNVPTRKFDLGFQTQSGSILTTAAGDTLYEWFALHYESTLRISTYDRPAKYQFAVLSDDGSILSVDDNQTGNYRNLINNDGTTPSRLRCASESIRMDVSRALPIKVDYFQGPRFHIALILLWREIPETVDEGVDPSVLADPACNLAGNSTFFDYNQFPSAPTATWNAMMSRGWKVLMPENYYLPTSVTQNPCPVGGVLLGV